jgi:hypothetical protein
MFFRHLIRGRATTSTFSRHPIRGQGTREIDLCWLSKSC